MKKPVCRFCKTELQHTFADLGMSPFSNSYVQPRHYNCAEAYYPLHTYVCHNCFLVQLEEFKSPDQIFSDYAYFSSYSKSWLEHCKKYVDMMIERFHFNESSFVTEIASNDGYLLQYFVERGIPVLGVEPAANVAEVAISKGIRTVVEFFSRVTARSLVVNFSHKADLILGNNVLAHVPDINDFVAGLKIFLTDNGVITFEFPHLLQLIQHSQFDTIYHEHFSYLSLLSVEKIFAAQGLELFDVQQLPTHGGSIRIFAQHAGGPQALNQRLIDLRQSEANAGLDRLETYTSFAQKIVKIKSDLLEFMIGQQRDGKKVVGYGAPAKGNTLLNYCGIGPEYLPFTVDLSPHKQGTLLPGSRIPVFAPGKITEARPDYVLILPWNLRDEIMAQMAHIKSWGGRFVVPIPQLEIIG
ncbi:MAG: methyltransferase domain-containing protein [Candidatus Rifleibacteriota bacterium]